MPIFGMESFYPALHNNSIVENARVGRGHQKITMLMR
jgi:hypothetical protein